MPSASIAPPKDAAHRHWRWYGAVFGWPLISGARWWCQVCHEVPLWIYPFKGHVAAACSHAVYGWWLGGSREIPEGWGFLDYKNCHWIPYKVAPMDVDKMPIEEVQYDPMRIYAP